MVGLDVQALVRSGPGGARWRPLRSLRWWRQSQHAGNIGAELSLCGIERARAVDNSSLPTGRAVNLKDPKNLTIYGGTFVDKATSAAGVHPFGNPVFSVIGGSGLSIEAMHAAESVSMCPVCK